MPKAKYDWTGVVEEFERRATLNPDASYAQIFEEMAAAKLYGDATAKQIKERIYYELRKKGSKETNANVSRDNNERVDVLVGKQQSAVPSKVTERGDVEERIDETQDKFNPNKKIYIGDIITGWVDGIQPYGAFIALVNGEKGLLHHSEMGNNVLYGTVEDYLEIGEEVQVKIIGRDSKGIKLSTKALGNNLLPKGITGPPTGKLSAPLATAAPALRQAKAGITSQRKAMVEEFLAYVTELENENKELKARVVNLEEQLVLERNKEHEAKQLLEKLRGLVSPN